jgi:hypothetical protein
MRKVLSCLLALLLVQLSYAQQDSTSEKPPLFKFDTHYLSNDVYQGRKDSVTLPYLSAGIEYVAPSGFYASADFSYLANQSLFNAYTLEAGYDFSKNNFNSGFSLSQSHYNSQSTSVKADIGTSLSSYAGYDFSFITATLTGALNLGHNRPDYAATFNLEHSFTSANDAFTFTPAFAMNASTQNYYDSYFSSRPRKRKNKTVTVITTTTEVVDASKFKLLDYELTGNFEYRVNHFSFYFLPSYAVPENPAVVVRATKNALGTTTKSSTENISSSFYFSVGGTYTVPFTKH